MLGIGLNLVRALERDWQHTLDDVASSRGWPTSRDVAKLAAHVSSLSAAYNDPACARAAMRDAGPARLGFAFARDVPKGAGAVRELVATGALDQDRPLRVLDLGAGLGAMTWGLVRALDAANRSPGVVEATWVDADASALDTATAIVKARQGKGPTELQVRTLVRSCDALGELGPFDVVLLGNVLSELAVDSSDEVRLRQHVTLLRSLLDRRLAPGGTLVVVEPALRDRTRHLHRVRDGLALAGYTVFAPCLYLAPCPMLERETDWCHEDLAVDLPDWLVSVARGAGLRHEGLTFSYLVLRKDGVRLADALAAEHLAPTAGRLRAVSDLIRTKGKREIFLCGEFSAELGEAAGASGPTDSARASGVPVCGRARVARLDRHATIENNAFEQMRRGAVVVIDPAPSRERARITSANSVREPSAETISKLLTESR